MDKTSALKTADVILPLKKCSSVSSWSFYCTVAAA